MANQINNDAVGRSGTRTYVEGEAETRVLRRAGAGLVFDFVDDRVAAGFTVAPFVVAVFFPRTFEGAFAGTFFVAAFFSARTTSSSTLCIERSQMLISIFEESR